MKKKLIILSIIIFSIGCLLFYYHRQYQNKKKWAEAIKLEILYNWQNRAFEMDCNQEEERCYQKADRVALNKLVVDLHVYNHMQSSYQLTVDEVLDYLSDEFDSVGNLRVYSRPNNIEKYINSFPEVKELSVDFGDHFNDYMKSHNYSNHFFRRMPYEEVVAALEEYKNSPEYVPPQEKEQTSTSDLEVTPELSNRIFNKMEDMKEAGYSQEEIDKAVKQIIEEYQNEE